MLSSVNIGAQISSVIEALSKAAVAEIAKVVEDGMLVWRMEICQRDNEILKLKDNIDILNNELKAANGGQDRVAIVRTNDDRQGSDVAIQLPAANNGSDENVPGEDRCEASIAEVRVKREPGEKDVTEAGGDALAPLQGHEQTLFQRESGAWRAGSMYNTAGLGPSNYLGLARSPQPGPSVPSGVVPPSSSGTVQQMPAGREQLAFSYYRNTYNNPVRWRNMKSLMFKRGFACLYCGKNFTRRAHLERHKLIHTGEKPYVCELCGRRFNQKSSVKEHMKIHQKGLQPKPEIQGAAEVQQVPEEKFSLDTPKVENGGSPLPTVKDELPKEDAQPAADCPAMPGVPDIKVATQPLNPVLSGSQPARGPVRGPGEDIGVFNRAGELWMPGPPVKKNPGTSNGVMGKNMPPVPGHGSLHPAPRHPPRPFHVSNAKPYRSPGDHSTSLARYSSPGSFSETSMSASFNCMPWQSNWARRNPSFEPAKPKKCFVCPFCCKIFERSGHLERHVRIHTGEKPYGCQICGRCFNQKGSLKLHLKTHRTEQSIEMLEAQQQENQPQPPMNPTATSTAGPPAPGDRRPPDATTYAAVTVKLEPGAESDYASPAGNSHSIVDDANFLWTSIIEDSGRSMSPLASTYSQHAASVVSHMVKDWLGPATTAAGPDGEPGGGRASPDKDVPLEEGKDDVEAMLQGQYAGADPSREVVSPFEVPDLNSLEEGCGADVDKQNGFICLTCGTSYECWSDFESHQCKDPS